MATKLAGGVETAAPKSRKLLKIGEVSQLSSVGIEALRFYEKSGLLDAPTRTKSGYRLYSPEVLERLSFIKRAQVLGFSLDEIKRLIDEARAGQSPCEEVRAIVRRRLEEIDRRVQEMIRYRDELSVTLKEWEKVGRMPGHVCGLIEEMKIEHGLRDAGAGAKRPLARSAKNRR